jgi:hypothetical protein
MNKYFVPAFIGSALAFSLVITRQKAQAQSDYKTDTASADTAAKTNNQEISPIFLTEIPAGYRDWKLISLGHLAVGSRNQLRAQLGNDMAIKAYREGKLPFPDGTMIAALHWDYLRSEENTKVLASSASVAAGGEPRSFVPGSPVNMQFMVKDSTKYAATGGWGFGDFKDGKPGGEALMKTCFACHQPAKDRDFVFARYAP